jgi:hypothetical protein
MPYPEVNFNTEVKYFVEKSTVFANKHLNAIKGIVSRNGVLTEAILG